MSDLTQFADFMEETDGFKTPKMPSKAFPEGKIYTVHSPDAKVGLRLNALADIMAKREGKVDISPNDIARLRLDDQAEAEFIRQVLGTELVDEMTSDGVKWEHMQRMSQYAFIRFAISVEAADNAVKNGLLSGKVQAPNRAARRKKPNKK